MKEKRSKNLKACQATTVEQGIYLAAIRQMGFLQPSKFWRANVTVILKQTEAGEKIALPLTYALEEPALEPVELWPDEKPKTVTLTTCRLTPTEEATLEERVNKLGFAATVDWVRRVLVTLIEQTKAGQKIELPLRFAVKQVKRAPEHHNSKPTPNKPKPLPKSTRSKRPQKVAN